MRWMVLLIAVMLGSSVAQAQSAAPDLKGTWVGKSRAVVFGTSRHQSSSPSDPAVPRVREAEFTMVVDGQDGALAWGYHSSSSFAEREPVALAIAGDRKTIVGSDTNGSYHMTLVSPDRMDVCYTHSGLSPNKSIVATCLAMDRRK